MGEEFVPPPTSPPRPSSPTVRPLELVEEVFCLGTKMWEPVSEPSLPNVRNAIPSTFFPDIMQSQVWDPPPEGSADGAAKEIFLADRISATAPRRPPSLRATLIGLCKLVFIFLTRVVC